MSNQSKKIELPDNAYRELKPGETYTPIHRQEKGILEVTMRSILFGVVMAILFAGAASYIALKLGQGIESAIPISILAIGFSALLARKSTMLENVNILAIGATSGIVAGGAVFVMPALFILDLEHNFFQIFIVPLLGAILGVLFLIPFRRYFVSDQHGKLPFPEGTAIIEVLVTGERGGKKAAILAYSIGLGAVYDFFMTSTRAWAENFSTAKIALFDFFTHKTSIVFNLYTSAATLGLGYLIGVRYASIIFAGSLMSYFILVPLFSYLGGYLDPSLIISPGGLPIADMPANDIFYNYARYVGIGGIFAAGVISIIKMSPVIFKAIRIAFKEMFSRKKEGVVETGGRTDSAIPMSWVMIMIVVVTLFIWLYFRFVVLSGQDNATSLSLISIAITLIIAFLFISVSAWAVAMISVTPISGMTLMTLMVTAVIFSAIGMEGKAGMLATLLIGGVVCTALSMAGSLVTQYKVGYWVGSTPKTIEWANIAGCVIASVVVTAVIILLAQVYGFSERRDSDIITVAEINNPSAFIVKLQNAENPVSHYLTIRMPAETRQMIYAYNDSVPPTDVLVNDVVAHLNRILLSEKFYSAHRFAQIQFSSETEELLLKLKKRSIEGGEYIQLNRLLIQDAYTDELALIYPDEQEGEQAAKAGIERNPLPAPQANAMAAVLGGIFGEEGAPWFLYGLGVLIALLVNLLGINPLAFALGMYLPIELNSPILGGAIVGWLVKHSTKKEKLSKVRHDKGILVASGLIAGGALLGVLDALIKFFQDKYSIQLLPDFNNIGSFGNWLGLILFILLAIFLYWDSVRASEEDE